MSQDIYFKKANKIFVGGNIPPQPSIIEEIEKELMKGDYTDFLKISRLIKKDLSLSSAMLVTVNSAFFGLRHKIQSVQRAVSFLGFQNVLNIVKSVALRKLVGNQSNQLLDEFWRTSTEIGLFSAYLAKTIGHIESNEAYTIGLFHNAGIPLMMKKYKNYQNRYGLGVRSKNKSVIDIENDHFGMNHSAVGALLAMKWKLPEIFYKTILYHHNVVDCLNNDEIIMELKSRVALLKIAEYVCYKIHENYDYITIFEWPNIKDTVLRYLPVTEGSLEKIVEHMIAMLGENLTELYT